LGTPAWLLVAILAILLAALLLPWHVRFVGRTAPPRARIEVRLFAGYAPAIPIAFGRSRRKTDDEKEPKNEKTGQRRKRRRRMPAGIADLAFGILDAIRLRRFRIAGRIGLEDPADTGILWGYLAPLAYGLSGPVRIIDLAPDFNGPCVDLEASGDIAIRPVRLLSAGAAFGWANMRTAI
jgi:hypothetical protein